MILKWKCGYCLDVNESDSTKHHDRNVCKCKKSAVDLEDSYMWIDGKVIEISRNGINVEDCNFLN